MGYALKRKMEAEGEVVMQGGLMRETWTGRKVADEGVDAPVTNATEDEVVEEVAMGEIQ